MRPGIVLPTTTSAAHPVPASAAWGREVSAVRGYAVRRPAGL